MVELRKRPAPPPPPPPAKKRAPAKPKAKKDAPKAAEPKEAPVATSAATPATEKPTTGGAPKVGDSVTLDGFGGEIETNDGDKTTLAKLVGDSKAGVVLFTYPKASTPGCKALSVSQSLTRIFDIHDRHYAGLPLPRLLRPSYGYGLEHLWS